MNNRAPAACAVVVVSMLLGGIGLPSLAHARVTADQLRAHKGKVVWLKRSAGHWSEAKIVRVAPPRVYIEFLGSPPLPVAISDIVDLRVGSAPPAPAKPPGKRPTSTRSGPSSRPQPGTSPSSAPVATPRSVTLRWSRSPPPPRRAKPKTRHALGIERVEWFGVRWLAGFVSFEDSYSGDRRPLGVLAFELTAFGLRWKHLYWEILRIGGGDPFYFILGSILAYPISLDSAGKHELRVGAHLTASVLSGDAADVLGSSGALLYWSYNVWRNFTFHLGVMQHSYPPGLSVTFGFVTYAN